MSVNDRLFIVGCLLLLVATFYATGDLTARDIEVGAILAVVLLFILWITRRSRGPRVPN
jgi:hypothetical protein